METGTEMLQSHCDGYLNSYSSLAKTVLQKQSKDNSGEKKKTVRPFYRGNLSGNPLFPLFNHLHLSLSRGIICLYSGHEH